MNTDNLVYCEIEGNKVIGKSYFKQNRKMEIEGVVVEDIFSHKLYMKRNPKYFGKIDKRKYILTDIKKIFPLDSILSREEIEELISSGDFSYIEGKLSK